MGRIREEAYAVYSIFSIFCLFSAIVGYMMGNTPLFIIFSTIIILNSLLFAVELLI